MGFPPFTRAIKGLVIINAAVYLLGLLLAGALPVLMGYVNAIFYLRPYFVVQRAWIWQLVTYSFFHAGLFHILFNMLTLWMFGATLEMELGFNRFLELYFFSAIGGALTTVAIAYLGLLPPLSFLGISPETATLGTRGLSTGSWWCSRCCMAIRNSSCFPCQSVFAPSTSWAF